MLQILSSRAAFKRIQRLFIAWICALCGVVTCMAADVVPESSNAVPASSSEPTATSAAPTAAAPSPTASPSPTSADAEETAEEATEEPWEYSPYRVQVWITSNDQRASAANLSRPLLEYLDRVFSAAWRLKIAEAPAVIAAGANRDLAAMDYASVTSADSVLALKKDHPEALRIRVAADAAQYIKQCLTTADRLAVVKQRGNAIGNPTLDGLDKIMSTVTGDSLAIAEMWKEPATEAVLLSRGMAMQLKKPDAKLIRLPIDQLVAEEIELNDKVFIVHVDCSSTPLKVQVREIDCLMRHFSPVITTQAIDYASLPAVVGQGLIDAFGPIVRIEDAGQKNAVGLIRAGRLTLDEQSPVLIKPDQFLQPMIRKNDRNGSPTVIGPLTWAFLHAKKIDGARVEMDYHAGQYGGLQGRKNNRTFRMALRVRPSGENSVIRLHAKGARDEPLAGYEIYEKKLGGVDMTLVGRTDWDGRITVEKNPEAAMRLLYVKNGGAILARLPIVPGLTSVEVADLIGDDQRLRAEAYIRGTQNAIVDLIAIRRLLAARIRLRLEKGQMEEAKELLQALREQPTYDTIANDMGKKFVQIKGRNSVEQKKIDTMFAQTREMLVNNINSKLLLDLEADVAKAEANGGVLKRQPEGEANGEVSKAPPANAAATEPKPAEPAAPST